MAPQPLLSNCPNERVKTCRTHWITHIDACEHNNSCKCMHSNNAGCTGGGQMSLDKQCQRDLSHIIIPFKSGEMLSCNTTSSIFPSLSTTSRYCLYTQALSLNGLIIKMNYQPINVKSMRSTIRNERTLEKMDCSECNQDIGENLLLKWNYQDLLKKTLAEI